MVLWRPTRPCRTNNNFKKRKRCPFHHRGLEFRSRKSRDTRSNRQVWPWSTKSSRAKVNPVEAHSWESFELQVWGNKDRASPHQHASQSATQRGPPPWILDAGPTPFEALHLPRAPPHLAQFSPFVLKETQGLFYTLIMVVSESAKIWLPLFSQSHLI